MLVDIICRETGKLSDSAGSCGPQLLSTVLSVSPEFSFSPFISPTVTNLRALSLASTIHPLTDSYFLSLVLLGLEQECPSFTSTLEGQDTLFHGQILLVIPTTDWDHITLLLFTQSISSYFFSWKAWHLWSLSTSVSSWQLVAAKRYSASSWGSWCLGGPTKKELKWFFFFFCQLIFLSILILFILIFT